MAWLATLQVQNYDVMWVPLTDREYVMVKESVVNNLPPEFAIDRDRVTTRCDLDTDEKYYRVYLPAHLCNL